MKLSGKLYLGFGSVLALLTAIAVLTIWTLTHLMDHIVEMKEHSALIAMVKEKEVNHLDWASHVLSGLVDTSSRQLSVETDPRKCAFGKWYYGPERAALERQSPELQAPLRQIETSHTALHESAARISSALEMNNREQALEIYYGETISTLEKVREDLAAVSKAIASHAALTEDEAVSYASGTTKLVILLGIVALVLGAVIALLIVSRAMRQLGGDPCEVVKAAHRIADGDLTVEVAYDHRFDSSALACMSRMTETLDRIVSEIGKSAHSLVTAVEQISSGNQSLSQRSSEQAAAVEEIAATLEETSSMIKQNSENAARAQEVSDQTSRMAESGGEVIIEAVNSINEVNQSGKKISEISKVINEIAFQTNLLALNAAVEAARAGEQGKGFAVVAEEVRNLAQRSGEAAREIASLIQESVTKVENATELANRGKDALQEIISAVKDTGRLISEVASASEEQLKGIDQIASAISEIDSLTQQDASLVEETASASEEVAGQAREVLAQIRRFKTRKA
ncbi:MAG TPA: methyl-accepting chemotaxis protein [Deltaproteobacteria bacterium]|jgi:methyl-accepting chemotaxis protein|nr:methyl-accepting chemotaxis protein [Deltaproteobacteria bacterium]HOI05558.1 methyl-accepting chemotaxis protein [Deltaproteobacteria bacterium]